MAEIELKTAPADFRFPTTNQSRHCFTRYIEFHRLIGGMSRGRMERSRGLFNSTSSYIMVPGWKPHMASIFCLWLVFFVWFEDYWINKPPLEIMLNFNTPSFCY